MGMSVYRLSLGKKLAGKCFGKKNVNYREWSKYVKFLHFLGINQRYKPVF